MHGAQGGTDAVLVEGAQPAGGPVRLAGVRAQHVHEQDLREVVLDQRAAGGGDPDLGGQVIDQLREPHAMRVAHADDHER
ncbi:hypothetical protein AB0L79_39010, partial [Streptomyces tendae]|uniref:hypothetical protein n=1 Tax=Streptomyces tendae TaxID=1932 RepID=UPI0034452745